MQVIAYLLGILVIFFTIKNTKYSNLVISAILSYFWLWVGIVYFLIYSSSINKVTFGFGFLFAMQGILFLIVDVIKPNISFKLRPETLPITGSILIIYATIVYPIFVYLLGHGYPQSPSFGVAPCPTTTLYPSP